MFPSISVFRLHLTLSNSSTSTHLTSLHILHFLRSHDKPHPIIQHATSPSYSLSSTFSMADTRCANPAYQLDVDEMTLEYLIYNTLKAHVEEWEPDYRSNSPAERLIRDPTTASKPRQAPILLAILDSASRPLSSNIKQLTASSPQLRCKSSRPTTQTTHGRRTQPSTSGSSNSWCCSPIAAADHPSSLKQAVCPPARSARRMYSGDIVAGRRMRSSGYLRWEFQWEWSAFCS